MLDVDVDADGGKIEGRRCVRAAAGDVIGLEFASVVVDGVEAGVWTSVPARDTSCSPFSSPSSPSTGLGGGVCGGREFEPSAPPC